jgi:phosphodiester glycosidase
MGRHTRCRIASLAIALLLALATAGAGAGTASRAGGWPAVLAQTALALPVASGIEYHRVALETADGPLDIHQLSVDLSNPLVKLGVGLARDRLMSDDEPVSSMVLRSGAIAGVNGDYFDIRQSGIPLNIVVRDGVLVRSPWRWVAFAVGRDGTARIARYRWTGTIRLPETGETRPLDGYNSGLYTNGVIAISDVRGFGAPDPGTAHQTIVELTPATDAGRYFVKQVWTQQPFYPPLPPNELLLVGLGAGADWLVGKMQAGMPVQVNLTTDPDWHDLALAIGGGPLLVQDGAIAEDPDPPAPRERNHPNPVVALGIARDGRTILLVEADGRQPDLSIGLTRPQLATYMQGLGAYQAMAFDSGGSATMVVRLPGQSLPAVVNTPSDGRERPVANALLVYSTAVPGPPVRLVLNAGQPLQLFAGARTALSVIGVDANGTPAALTEPVTVTGAAGLVTVGENGTLTAGAGGVAVQSAAMPQGALPILAGQTAGADTLVVQSGPARGTLPVSVTTRLARLVAAPQVVDLDPGAEAQFALRAQDGAGRPVILPDAAAEWVLRPPSLGTISASGAFTAGDAAVAGTAVARLGGATVFVRVAVGSAARYIDQFDRGGWTFRGYPATVSGAVTPAPAPGREGHASARLEFHLDGAGTRAAFLMTDLPLPGEPAGISLWVLGDGSRVWLRGTYADANGDRGTFTLAREVDWQGWRSVSSVLPSGLDYPISLVSLYVVEPDPDRSPSGILYLSSLRALYPADPSR